MRRGDSNSEGHTFAYEGTPHILVRTTQFNAENMCTVDLGKTYAVEPVSNRLIGEAAVRIQSEVSFHELWPESRHGEDREGEGPVHLQFLPC